MVNRTGIIFTSVALNLVLAAAVIVLGRQPSPPPLAEAIAVTESVSNRIDSDIPAPATNPPTTGSRPVRFHWGLVESADYHQYIANLRAIGCPERLIRDIIVLDVAKLYSGKFRQLSPPSDGLQPWHSNDRRQARSREFSNRMNTLQAEQKALIKELLGIEWNESAEELLRGEGIFGLVLGFLPETVPTRIIAISEEYSDTARKVDEKTGGILLAEDREELARLRQSLMTRLTALMSPGEFEELSLRAQSLAKFLEGDIKLDGVMLSGSEFRELCRHSRLTGDVIQEELFHTDKELSEAEEEQRQQAFEAEARKLLGPARFADFQRAQLPEFQEAFEFTEEHHLPVSTAAKISDAMRHASAQAIEIKQNESLSPDEQVAALTVLKSVTVNTLSAALGSKYEEYARTKGTDLDDLIEIPSTPTGGRP